MNEGGVTSSSFFGSLPRKTALSQKMIKLPAVRVPRLNNTINTPTDNSMIEKTSQKAEIPDKNPFQLAREQQSYIGRANKSILPSININNEQIIEMDSEETRELSQDPEENRLNDLK